MNLTLKIEAQDGFTEQWLTKHGVDRLLHVPLPFKTTRVDSVNANPSGYLTLKVTFTENDDDGK